MKISAIIVIHKSPQHVDKSLLSIADFVDEIIVGDYQMTTKIPSSILNKVKVIKVNQDIPFADIIKEDLKKYATGDYIFYLDPDEIIPDKLKKELKNLIGKHDAFYLPRKNIIFGKWIEYSRWWPDYQLRFFRKNTVLWPKTIHPVPEIKGSAYKVAQEEGYAIVHYNYDSISHYLEKAMRYARFEAEQHITNNESLNISKTIKKAISEFISRFFGSDGYRDGMHGFVLALLQMFYYFLVYFYYWEMKKYANISGEMKPTVIRQYFVQGLYESNYWLVKKKLVTFKEKFQMLLQNKMLSKSYEE